MTFKGSFNMIYHSFALIYSGSRIASSYLQYFQKSKTKPTVVFISPLVWSQSTFLKQPEHSHHDKLVWNSKKIGFSLILQTKASKSIQALKTRDRRKKSWKWNRKQSLQCSDVLFCCHYVWKFNQPNPLLYTCLEAPSFWAARFQMQAKNKVSPETLPKEPSGGTLLPGKCQSFTHQ